MKKNLIFTDGAAKGNPGPGGYGAVILVGGVIIEIGEGKEITTNNEMELKAVVEALKNIPKEEKNVEVYSDSKYVIDGAKGWTFGWVKNGWKTKAGTDVLHMEMWKELIELLKKVQVEWHKIPGHVGIIGNERADTIASDFAEKKIVNLYNGTRVGYKYEIEDTSYDKAEEEKRSAARKRQSQKAFSYISAVNGVVETHATWKECEDRVKGKKGVRYKKALNAEEEKETIKEFGGK